MRPVLVPARSRPSLDDAALMRRIQRGDTAAFGRLYDRHATAVYSVARRILRDPAGAEDVTQEAFISMWRARADYAPERGAAGAWLTTIARHRAIDALRRLHPEQPFDAHADRREAPERTDDEVMRRADGEAVGGLLERLPPDQREVIELAYRDGLTQTEIATRLDLPLGTVKSRARLGLGRLREAYNP